MHYSPKITPCYLVKIPLHFAICIPGKLWLCSPYSYSSSVFSVMICEVAVSWWLCFTGIWWLTWWEQTSTILSSARSWQTITSSSSFIRSYEDWRLGPAHSLHSFLCYFAVIAQCNGSLKEYSVTTSVASRWVGLTVICCMGYTVVYTVSMA